MTTLIQDVRYALRQLRKTPAFTVTVLHTGVGDWGERGDRYAGACRVAEESAGRRSRDAGEGG